MQKILNQEKSPDEVPIKFRREASNWKSVLDWGTVGFQKATGRTQLSRIETEQLNYVGTRMQCWRKLLHPRRSYCLHFPKVDAVKTIHEMQEEINTIVGVKDKYVEHSPNWDGLSDMIPASQGELPVRSMRDSYDEVVIPLASDKKQREKFTNVIGSTRIGRILEAMDSFAVWIALKFISNPKQKDGWPTPYGIVTGHVDNISFSHVRPSINHDLILKGHVSYAGRSSLEVNIWLEQTTKDKPDMLTKAYFIMVARNRDNTASLPVNKLKPTNEEESSVYEKATKRMEYRKSSDQTSLLKATPTGEEQDYIHNIFINSMDSKDKSLRRRKLPENSVWMKSTKMSCSYFPHPENRNFHMTLFGGYIMRACLEISWIGAMHHVKQRSKLIEISNMSFEKPIHIGAFLLISSEVIYTKDNFMEIMAACEVEDLKTGEKHTTNTMYFTYESDKEVVTVLPQTYQEAMLLLNGKRHFEHVMSNRK